MNEKRTTIFSYFSVKRGLDNMCEFSVNSIIKWSKKKPDRHKGGINDKVLLAVGALVEEGYLSLEEKLTSNVTIDSTWNVEKITEECKRNRFAVIYLDELKKILEYQNPNPKDTLLNTDIILLVFAYLRMKIYRRRNMMMPEEYNLDSKNDHEYDIQQRRTRSPEAYDCFYYEIGNELGITARAVSKAVEVLNELQLIYSEALPRIKYNDGETIKWRTDHTIFCNYYKREGSNLLAQGEQYYLIEINNKKKKLNISY